MQTMRRQNRCKGRTKAGKPCGAAATAGGLCFFHANPNKASELGRIGGRSKYHVTVETADPLPPLDTAAAVLDTGSRLYADVLAGKVPPRVAASLAPLMNVLLRASEMANLEQQLARLKQLLKLRDGTADDPGTENHRDGES